MRLLFAEDDKQLLTAISRGLREAGHDVDQATTGGQALTLALAGEYDVIILDVLLPGPVASRLPTIRKRPRVPSSCHAPMPVEHRMPGWTQG